MKLQLLILFVLGFFLLNCGKKEDPPPQTNQQQNTQQQQQQQTTQQTEKKDTTKTADVKSQEDKKKEEEKKKLEEEKKKKEAEEKKKKEEEKKKEVTSTEDGSVSQEIDFAPIFAKRCVKCHGKDLKGKVEGVPDLTKSETQNKSTKQLIAVITNGKLAETEDGEDMPAWKNKLTEDEIKAAAKYVLDH